MPTKTIGQRVDESFPLEGKELMIFALASPLLHNCAKKDGVNDNMHVTRYFGEHPDVFSIYNKLVLWMLEQGIITEDALK